MDDLKGKLSKIAASQRLNLTSEELETFGRQAESVLEAFDQLDKVDTEGVPASYHAVNVEPVLRQDAVESSSSPTQNHAKKEKGYLVGPRMMK